MTAPLDWRKIERALVDAFAVNQWAISDTPSTGDKEATEYSDFGSGDALSSINLTALAKHLADELGGTT